MAFRNYENNTAVDLVAALKGQQIALARDPVFDGQVVYAGGRFILQPRGLLRPLGDMPMLVGSGVHFLPPEPGRRQALAVWDLPQRVYWDANTRSLVLIQSDPELGNVTLRQELPAELDVVLLSTKDGSPGSVWADNILVAYTHTRDGVRPVYSWCPVKSPYFPLVESSGIEVTADRVLWTVRFKGDVAATFSLPSGGARLDPIKPELVPGEKTVNALAIWPPQIIPAWRLYTLVSVDLFDGRMAADIWLGRAGESPLRKVTSSELLGMPTQPEGIRIDAQAPSDCGPTFLELRRGDSVGYFPLLTSRLQPGGEVKQVAIDFGTTTTTVAADGYDQALDLGSVTDIAQPWIVFSNTLDSGQPSIDVAEPWIPSVRARYYGELHRLQQIPTGLFKRLDDGSPASKFPFVGHTFVSSGFDLHQPGAFAERWNPELKWGHGPSETREDRKRFLTSIVLWVAALLRRTTGTISLRATYPLAFTRQRAVEYRQVLDAVASEVGALTGVAVEIPAPHYREREDRRPFVDESTPLLRGAIEQFHVEGSNGEPFVFVADLGGETLDVQLALLSRDRTYEAFRIVACESVRIGANCAIDFLDGQLLSMRAEIAASVAETLKPRIKRTIVSRVVRANQLGAALQSKKSFDGTSLEWVSPEGPTRFIRQLDVYFGLVAEYCARFVAGTLKNRAGLRERIRSGPGVGMVREDVIRADSEKMAFAIQPFLVGNGWRALQTFFDAQEGGSDSTPEGWLQRILFGRIRELLTGDDVEPVLPDYGGNVLVDKTRTVLGTLALEQAAPRAEAATLPIVAAPNGFDDQVSSKAVNWTTLAGAGGESIEDPLQNLHLTQPPLPPPDRLMVTATGRKRYEAFIRNINIPERKEDWRNVRKLQNAEADPQRVEPRRDISTARAAWESVFRPLLLEP